MSNKKKVEAMLGAHGAQEVVGTRLPARKTKVSLLLELIGREDGATLEELSSATAWLPHTARAAVTGLRKRGHDVSCTRIGGVGRYTIKSSK